MKSLTFNFRVALSASLCCVVLAAATASAQEAASAWVRVAPPGEAFTVMMPRMSLPVAEKANSGELNVAGQRYSLQHDDAEYTVWSFKAAKLPVDPGNDRETDLDRCAELAWKLLIEPHWKKLKRPSPSELMKYNLTYDSARPSDDYRSRSYHLNLDERRGTTHIYVVGSQIYIVAAAGTARESANVGQFIKSFGLSQPATIGGRAGTGTGGGVGMGTGGGVGSGSDGKGGSLGSGGAAKETDYNRTFRASETTQKARILAKPEPSYTESARKFGVVGKVRVRIALMSSGTVSGIAVVAQLPHGLTQEAIEAARKIKFEPAIKDGRPVSQYVTVDYNFNIY